eukprot:SAG31_NODE_1076_length_10037_cov_8.357818_4_plen_153_part_00
MSRKLPLSRRMKVSSVAQKVHDLFLKGHRLVSLRLIAAVLGACEATRDMVLICSLKCQEQKRFLREQISRAFVRQRRARPSLRFEDLNYDDKVDSPAPQELLTEYLWWSRELPFWNGTPNSLPPPTETLAWSTVWLYAARPSAGSSLPVQVS